MATAMPFLATEICSSDDELEYVIRSENVPAALAAATAFATMEAAGSFAMASGGCEVLVELELRLVGVFLAAPRARGITTAAATSTAAARPITVPLRQIGFFPPVATDGDSAQLPMPAPSDEGTWPWVQPCESCQVAGACVAGGCHSG